MGNTEGHDIKPVRDDVRKELNLSRKITYKQFSKVWSLCVYFQVQVVALPETHRCPRLRSQGSQTLCGLPGGSGHFDIQSKAGPKQANSRRNEVEVKMKLLHFVHRR